MCLMLYVLSIFTVGFSVDLPLKDADWVGSEESVYVSVIVSSIWAYAYSYDVPSTDLKV